MEVEKKLPYPDANFFLQKFHGIEQLLAKTQFGVAVLDRELRYIHVNDRMATIDGASIEQHVGSLVKEVDPQIALALEPMLLRAIREERPFVDLEVEMPMADPGLTTPHWTWQVCCYPLKSDDRAVLGASLVVQDITEQRLKEAAQAERLKFEALLSTLSATFINVAVSDVDGKIERG